MNFLRRLTELRQVNADAAKANEAILEQAGKDHETALRMREHVSRQTERLVHGDARNHYSESLTKAFRGRTA